MSKQLSRYDRQQEAEVDRNFDYYDDGEAAPEPPVKCECWFHEGKLISADGCPMHRGPVGERL